MPARNVDQILIGNWTNLGATAPVPKWSVDITVNWTKQDGTPGTVSVTKTFPNVLAGVPLKRIRRYMEEIILNELRIQQGIDEDPDA